ncbi:unnamed protein product [Lactuca saligna]|uniref:Uncharacterized protein n=1 Tax=Lactuca saligna TaxID=75948 RepID=A0AA35VR97_LACSI|nr:unnamed protein product [Lactuca saligna]
MSSKLFEATVVFGSGYQSLSDQIGICIMIIHEKNPSKADKAAGCCCTQGNLAKGMVTMVVFDPMQLIHTYLSLQLKPIGNNISEKHKQTKTAIGQIYGGRSG